ncbi:NADH:flavin oxidoreductase [uncultured Flavobacterium sp.]|uniref:NADH:flavin oxidoreductase n=1 Tax=uncultured Flavobacterium sp. TaxID=165435 RepID=UPI00292E255F|nr:NADH:flavin oxidoreductase [uncultured Flavobacterium sp.]
MEISNHLIFQPVDLWGRKLDNRCVVAPMSRVSSNLEGLATEEIKDYYTSFAEGKFGVIITEGLYTDNSYSRGYQNQPGLVTESQICSWKTVTDSVKDYSSVFIAQLMHAGSLSQFSGRTISSSAVKPAGFKMAAYGGEGDFPTPKVMSVEDIEAVKAGFIASAKNAYLAGFDGVEIHGANGYLLDQFLTPELNQRTDQYGGNVKNRFRIVAEIIGGIRNSLPDDFIIGLRLSEGKVNDLTYRWKDGIEAAKSLFLEVKLASPDFIHIAVQTGEWERDSFFSDSCSLAYVAKVITGLPVIANGGLHDLGKAEKALGGNHADLIAIGKAALADPYWPVKTIKGEAVTEFHRDMLWPEATISHQRKKNLDLLNI